MIKESTSNRSRVAIPNHQPSLNKNMKVYLPQGRPSRRLIAKRHAMGLGELRTHQQPSPREVTPFGATNLMTPAGQRTRALRWCERGRGRQALAYHGGWQDGKEFQTLADT